MTTAGMAVVPVQASPAHASPAHAQLGPASVAAGGTSLSWGQNAFGQLGNGTNAGSRLPVPVRLPTGTSITATEAGEEHALALTAAGTVLAWGHNNYGQLGNGTNASSRLPVLVRLPTGATAAAISAGEEQNLVLTSAGTVLAWGYNNFGQLGNGTNLDSNLPVPVRLPAGVRITAISSGRYFSLALTSAGTVYSWGLNALGQLGNGVTPNSNLPVRVLLPAGVRITAISAGRYHALALTSTGTVLSWGYNFQGQLGNGSNVVSRLPVPVRLPTGTTISAVSAGYYHSLALSPTGVAFAWGYNRYGQLGNGANTDRNVPVEVNPPVGTAITAIAGGGYHSAAMTDTWTALAWGLNHEGQVGNGTTVPSNRPVPVRLPDATTVTAIAAGRNHSSVIAGPPPEPAKTR